ncbi:hypothetical protein [Chryseobacterium gleum]|uniref:hypothetical protein n=1 Tax=Chryseobacterium gleum TaxID=250 RepID=UPI0028A83A64|nr:hypothetical protein [Chryseobacterium gleum]
MKKLIICSLFTCSIVTNAQFTISTNGLGLPQDNSIYNKVNSAGKSLSYEDIQGSPYYNKEYSLAKFSGTEESAPARYNSFKDEIEFKKGDKSFVLPKNENFSRITLTNNNEILVYLNTNDDLSGYFLEIVGGKYGLYKKIKTIFIDAISANSTYETDKPAKFKNLDPVYYIKTESGYIKKPKKIKEIAEAFPAKKEEIEKFAKSNNIKINKEEDLIKLVKFLNQ